jgi:hypothetical protein
VFLFKVGESMNVQLPESAGLQMEKSFRKLQQKPQSFALPEMFQILNIMKKPVFGLGIATTEAKEKWWCARPKK